MCLTKSILPALVLASLLFSTASCKESKTSDLEQEGNTLAPNEKRPDESSSAIDSLAPDTKNSTDQLPAEPTATSAIGEYKRPSKSQIISPVFPVDKLFHAWVGDNSDPHAAFDISKDGFFVVDYDGDGNMPYLLKKDSLIIYYEEAPQRYRIRKITKDSLVLGGADYNLRYTRWRN